MVDAFNAVGFILSKILFLLLLLLLLLLNGFI